ncbi:MAG: segregation/condensation protein A [Firmicutes bacterium]|nr:segregation/condensation protein A [Bacillota bacterium]
MGVLDVLKKSSEKNRYHVKLPAFEGPFDLLYHLVNKEKIDIWEIPLAKITEDYLFHLQSMQELKIDLAGEFLVMAASLLYLKSQLLLPQSPSFLPEETEALFFGSKEELVRKLLEYKRAKLIAAHLKERENQQKRIFLRSPEQHKMVIVSKQGSLYPHDLDSLKHAFEKLKRKNVEEKETFFLPEEISFGQKLQKIVLFLKEKEFSRYRLDDFLIKRNVDEIVLTLVVFLELAKRGKIFLQQQKVFGVIHILNPEI